MLSSYTRNECDSQHSDTIQCNTVASLSYVTVWHKVINLFFVLCHKIHYTAVECACILAVLLLFTHPCCRVIFTLQCALHVRWKNAKYAQVSSHSPNSCVLTLARGPYTATPSQERLELLAQTSAHSLHLREVFIRCCKVELKVTTCLHCSADIHHEHGLTVIRICCRATLNAK